MPKALKDIEHYGIVTLTLPKQRSGDPNDTGLKAVLSQYCSRLGNILSSIFFNHKTWFTARQSHIKGEQSFYFVIFYLLCIFTFEFLSLVINISYETKQVYPLTSWLII